MRLPVNQNMIPFLDEVSMVINSRKDILCIRQTLRQTFIAPYPLRFATLVVILEMFGKIFIILIPITILLVKLAYLSNVKSPLNSFIIGPNIREPIVIILHKKKVRWILVKLESSIPEREDYVHDGLFTLVHEWFKSLKFEVIAFSPLRWREHDN